MLHKLVTPGDLLKDSALAGLGFSPAAFFHMEPAVFFGFLNLLVVVVFRAVELFLKYRGRGSAMTAETGNPPPSDARRELLALAALALLAWLCGCALLAGIHLVTS